MERSCNLQCFTTTFKVPENARWFHLFAMWGFVYDYQLEKIP